MNKKYAGMHYWLLSTAMWIGIIIVLRLDEDENYSTAVLALIAIVGGYITALIFYNLEDHIRYIFREIYSSRRRMGISVRNKKPKFKFRLIPDLKSSGKN